jgi:hypothetical protein
MRKTTNQPEYIHRCIHGHAVNFQVPMTTDLHSSIHLLVSSSLYPNISLSPCLIVSMSRYLFFRSFRHYPYATHTARGVVKLLNDVEKQ